jgi:hypothetical protein
LPEFFSKNNTTLPESFIFSTNKYVFKFHKKNSHKTTNPYFNSKNKPLPYFLASMTHSLEIPLQTPLKLIPPCRNNPLQMGFKRLALVVRPCVASLRWFGARSAAIGHYWWFSVSVLKQGSCVKKSRATDD